MNNSCYSKIVLIFCFLFFWCNICCYSVHADKMDIITTDLETGESYTEQINGFPEGSPNSIIPVYTNPSAGYSPNKIIGNDDRYLVNNTTLKPYRYIGILTINEDGNITLATAFLVGDNLVLTAARNVYHKNKKISSITFTPGVNGLVEPYNSVQIKKTHIPSQYMSIVDQGTSDGSDPRKYDYALLELKSNIGSSIGYFSLGGYNSLLTIDNLSNLDVEVVGYPINKQRKMYGHMAAIHSFKDGYLMCYYNDTDKGQSGSPVFVGAEDGYYVVGIHLTKSGKYEYNVGRYITRNIYLLVKNFS